MSPFLSLASLGPHWCLDDVLVYRHSSQVWLRLLKPLLQPGGVEEGAQ